MNHAARRWLCLAVTTAVAAVPTSPHRADAGSCGGAITAAGLTSLFAEHIEGVAGADYQRALPLPDGRTLWMFQDAFIERPSGDDQLVHNVGLIQDGACFRLLRSGSAEDPAPWLAPELTESQRRWFWPLGGLVTDSGNVAVFVAELRELGTGYLTHAEPVATWVATIDAATLTPTELRPAPDPGPALYGWSVASDAAYTYLYGHCYRQFGFGFLGHHECAAEVTVARTPRGDLDDPLQYWDGSAWVADPSAAVNIAPATGPGGVRRVVNPMQIALVDGRWIAATKDGDWWGDTIYLDRAPSPSGPWTTTAVLDAVPLASDHNTYFASFVGSGGGEVVLGLSNNAWGGHRSDAYRPTFTSVPLAQWDVPPHRDEPDALRSTGERTRRSTTRGHCR